ncbi:hypothetical protein PybrP1_012963 [[Pythium] brassicae (nom. inval.)]|nr:hypothetical protein PybrP1_012963 [[Pythium] brassicae (nom. inval.)]
MEKGVGLWLRDGAGADWRHAVVVRIAPAPKDNAAAPREVVVRLSDGARKDVTLHVDVAAIENEQEPDMLLANSHDMDLVEDLIQLPHLHEPGICHTLNERFKANEIYTLTGEVLLAINPFKTVGLYSDTIVRKYIRNGDKRALGQEVSDMPPHVFSVADKAYRALAAGAAAAAAGDSDDDNRAPPDAFHYLNQSACTRRQDGVDDAAQFRALKSAMQVMGLDAASVESIFRTVAALLHVGNLAFAATDPDASGTDGSQIAADECAESLAVVLAFLEVDQVGLEQAICFRTIQAKDETYSIALAPEAAENTRDALARFVYGKLFDWLVGRINEIVACDARGTAADKTQQANHHFVVHHYAGRVAYDTFGFCEKNKDVLYPEITSLLARSSQPFVRDLLKLPAERRRASSARPVGIVKGRAASTASRIPEAAGTDDLFDADERQQAATLLVAFLLQAHAERYPELAGSSSGAGAVAGIQVGTTRVFFRRSAIQFVEAQLAKRYGEFVVLIQAAARGMLRRRHYQRLKVAAVAAQRVVRGFVARRRFRVLLQRHRERQAALLREQQAAEQRLRADEERRAAERKRKEQEKEKAQEQQRVLLEEQRQAAALEEEQNRLTAQSTQSGSSDPVSDDSSEEATAPVADDDDEERERIPTRSARGTSRFRFTKEYTVAEDTRATMSTNGPRAVAMEPGDTVLHVAANCCNEHDVLKLLQNGSDINARNRHGRTPLHTASLYANVEVVGILLDWEADVVAVDDDGNTPLHLTKDPHIARMLLEAGCTPNIVNADGRTPLIEAVDRGEANIVKSLLKFKADVLFRELKHHQTAMHLAVRKGHYAIVMELCKADDIKGLILLTDRNENNALHFAVSRDRKNGYRLVDYLVKHGADVNKVNARLQTPLVVHIMTTRQTDPAIAELFLAKGADPNVPLPDGSTLLHVAVERELLDIACALVRHGAFLNQPDGRGRLVVDVAQRKHLRKLFSAITQPPTWIEEKDRKACMQCDTKFKFGNRRHHCRHCGCVCCSDCSAFSVEMFRFPKDFPGRVTSAGKSVKDPQRVCKTCHAVFKMRSAQKESKSGFMARVLGYEWDEIHTQ